jgi:hypothetical protein
VKALLIAAQRFIFLAFLNSKALPIMLTLFFIGAWPKMGAQKKISKKSFTLFIDYIILQLQL